MGAPQAASCKPLKTVSQIFRISGSASFVRVLNVRLIQGRNQSSVSEILEVGAMISKAFYSTSTSLALLLHSEATLHHNARAQETTP